MELIFTHYSSSTQPGIFVTTGSRICKFFLGLILHGRLYPGSVFLGKPKAGGSSGMLGVKVSEVGLSEVRTNDVITR